MARELDNVRAALDWSSSSEGDAAIGAALTAGFALIWMQILSQTDASRLCPQAMSLFGECRDRIEKMLAYQAPDLGLSAALERRMFTGTAGHWPRRWRPSEQSRAVFGKAWQLTEGGRRR